MTSDPLIEESYEFLRGHLAGRIRFDGERIEIKVAPTPSGEFVAPVMVAMLRSVDVVLELPDDSMDAIEVQVSLEEIKEDGPDAALCDRWCIYHGEPPDVRWARMTVDAGRYRGHFIDGIALARPNPFSVQEPALCKALNVGHMGLLERAAERHGGHKLVQPRLVGVDPWGFDLRCPLGVARIPASPPIEAADRVLARLQALAGSD